MSVKFNQLSNAIRFLSIDAVQKANSGHPGMPMGMADVATVLFKYHLRFNPKNPNWINRDRFILSAGHGSMLLYALLYLTGFESITIEDIKNAEGILKLRKNRILSLDIESKKKVEANLNKVETNESGNTYLGDFETTGPEYATHLELLNTHNYSSYSNLNKFNTTKTGAGVNCFIIDTGINSDNAFLDSGNLNFSTGVDGEKALDVGDGTFTSNTTHGNIDDHGHGTLCAMLIAGDKFGVARDVTLYSQKVLDDKKSGSIDTITDAIRPISKT